MGFLDHILDAAKFVWSKFRRVLICVALAVPIAVGCSLAVAFGLEKFRVPIVLVFFSFWAMGFLLSIMAIVYGVAVNAYMERHHRDLWRKYYYSWSIRKRIETSRAIRSLNDPFLRKAKMLWSKAGFFVFTLWLIVCVLIVIGFFVWRHFWP